MSRVTIRSVVLVGLVLTLFAGLLLPLKPEVLLAAPVQAGVDITVEEIVVSGLERPVQVTHAGDGSGRLFVVEQPGRLRIVEDGALLGAPFLDIAHRVNYGGERGLLSVAFPPDYATKGYFYVNYTRQPDGYTVVARYFVTANPDVADANSEQVILTVDQPYVNHNGGYLAFGPRDGFLYIGMGDGGAGGDPQNNAQNPDSLLGKMLRIDVESGDGPYAVPASNPFVGASGFRDEIWALGLRNPWRFSFDRETGDLYIGDVGQNQWEEISYQAAGTPGGLNFGWRCREASQIFDASVPCNDPAFLAGLTDPIAEYSHGEGLSVTGGSVYRGALYPALVGRYFYADFVQGKIWSLYKTGSNPDTWSSPELELDTGLNISAFGEDEAGELYVVDWAAGTVRRLADASSPPPDLTTSQKRASSDGAHPGEVLTFTIQLNNTGGLVSETVFLTDTVPAGLNYVPGSLTATDGTADDSGRPVLRWQGVLTFAGTMTMTYLVSPTGSVSGTIVNQAFLTGDAIEALTLTDAIVVTRPVLTATQNATFIPDYDAVYLPLILKPWN